MGNQKAQPPSTVLNQIDEIGSQKKELVTSEEKLHSDVASKMTRSSLQPKIKLNTAMNMKSASSQSAVKTQKEESYHEKLEKCK